MTRKLKTVPFVLCYMLFTPTVTAPAVTGGEIEGVYGPENGFNAKEDYFKLALENTTFRLQKISYNDDGTNSEIMLSGNYEIKDENIILNASSKETKIYKTFALGFIEYNTKEIKQSINVEKNIEEQKIMLTFNAFGKKISLRKYRSPPSPLYEALSGTYKKDDEDGVYSALLTLSNQNTGFLGDYGDYFSFGEIFDYGTHFDSYSLYGRYTIKNGKLNFIVTVTRIYKEFRPSIMIVHEPVTIPVGYKVDKNGVVLKFSVFWKKFAFFKKIK